MATSNYQRPWMYPLQEQAFFCPERYSVTEASTKAGKTVGCMAWLFEQAALCPVPGRNYWWVAPIYPQAKIAFRRLKRGLPKEVFRSNESELTLTLSNGAVLWFKGADNTDSLYGEDVYAAVIDEATRCKDEAWYAVRSTLTATRGPVRIIGNVKGKKNWAYKMARQAQAGAPDMRYTKITALDAVAAGVLDAAEVEDAQRTLPALVFRELYLAEPSDDGGNPFGLAAIAEGIAPLADTRPVVWGWDLAKSVDWTVGIGLDAGGHVCRFERWQGPWQETIRKIRLLTGATPALVDGTGVGAAVVEALQEDRANFEGMVFSAPSKQVLVAGLVVAIQQRQITYPDGPIVQELESFEYQYLPSGVRYSAPDGQHDDCVMALALAVQHGQRAGHFSVTATVIPPATARPTENAYIRFREAADALHAAHQGTPDDDADDPDRVAVASTGSVDARDPLGLWRR